LFRSKWDWSFFTSNEVGASDRSIYLCRGKVLGGSSALNVLLYNRGDAKDYDSWETDFGCKDWSSAHVLPHFKQTQDDQIGLCESDPKHHSNKGELAVDHVRYQNELSKTFLEACKQKGLPANDDFNNWGRSQEGYGRFTVNEKNGERCHAANAFLEPVLKDPSRKLQVVTSAAVQQIIFEPKGGLPVATGVRFTCGNSTHMVKLASGGEVLLAGGAIQSPQMLMVSGVGPKQHLEEHGVKVVHDLPAVGQNLQDHPAAVVSYQCPPSKRGISVTSKIRLWGTQLPHPGVFLEWLFMGSGPLTSVGCDHGGFFRTTSAQNGASPNLQLRFLPAQALSPDGMATFAKFKNASGHPDGFSFQSIAARPESRGCIKLAGADPNMAPVIEGMFLAEKNDVVTLREGLKFSRELAKQPAFAEYVGTEVFPGTNVTSDADLDKYIRSSVHTANALVGTCRMGPAHDPAAVVDTDMFVKGVKGLRVCDASVMPKLPGGQGSSITLMIAQRAAKLIDKERLLRAS
jgi:choline dehydrogenase-like flavoprotein